MAEVFAVKRMWCADGSADREVAPWAQRDIGITKSYVAVRRERQQPRHVAAIRLPSSISWRGCRRWIRCLGQFVVQEAKEETNLTIKTISHGICSSVCDVWCCGDGPGWRAAGGGATGGGATGGTGAAGNRHRRRHATGNGSQSARNDQERKPGPDGQPADGPRANGNRYRTGNGSNAPIKAIQRPPTRTATVAQPERNDGERDNRSTRKWNSPAVAIPGTVETRRVPMAEAAARVAAGPAGEHRRWRHPSGGAGGGAVSIISGNRADGHGQRG